MYFVVYKAKKKQEKHTTGYYHRLKIQNKLHYNGPLVRKKFSHSG